MKPKKPATSPAPKKPAPKKPVVKIGVKVHGGYKHDVDYWIRANQYVKVKSSNVHSIKYEAANKTMWVRFKVRGTSIPGPAYSCPNFPRAEAKKYFIAASMGKFHWKLRRGGRTFTK